MIHIIIFSDEASHNTAIECMDILSKLVNDKVNSTNWHIQLTESERKFQIMVLLYFYCFTIFEK